MEGNDKRFRLITFGDSWTWGSEIFDRKYLVNGHPPVNEHFNKPEHVAFRVPKIWPSKLGTRLNADVLNLSEPGSSNDRIVRRVMEHFIQKPIDPDILVVIGWSSPERKDFFYDDGKLAHWQTIWPAMTHDAYPKPEIYQFAKMYQTYFWNVEEYMNRFVMQSHYLENFFKRHNINYLMFNAFYDTRGLVENWDSIASAFGKTSRADLNIWKSLDHSRIMPETFHDSIMKSNITDKFWGLHPSPDAHSLWAECVHKYLATQGLV